MLIALRSGSPNEMLLTPSTVRTSYSLFMRRIASRVRTACSCCAPTVRVRQSTKMSCSGMPYFLAAEMILRAMRSLSSTVSGTPFLSTHSATIAAPYFAATGKMPSRESSSPLTELTIALP